MLKRFAVALSVALAVFMSMESADAQSSTRNNAPQRSWDLPFEKPQPEKDPRNAEVPKPPPPPEDPTPPEQPPTFHGEPIPSENSTIFYVIDSSCSMGWDRKSYVDDEGNSRSGNRMDRAKAELRKSIRALPKSFKFNCLAFGCSIKRMGSQMVEANASNKNRAIGWVNSLYPSDGTMTGPATKAALNDKQNKSVVLLTDGSPNCGASGYNGHKSMIKGANTQGAVITVFGVGATGSLKSWCQQVARENNGNYVDVP